MSEFRITIRQRHVRKIFERSVEFPFWDIIYYAINGLIKWATVTVVLGPGRMPFYASDIHVLCARIRLRLFRSLSRDQQLWLARSGEFGRLQNDVTDQNAVSAICQVKCFGCWCRIRRVLRHNLPRWFTRFELLYVLVRKPDREVDCTGNDGSVVTFPPWF